MQPVYTEPPPGWHRVGLEVPAALAEDVAAACHALGSCGLEQQDEAHLTRLVAYFASAQDLPDVLAGLQRELERLGVAQAPLEVGRVDPEDWEVQWRRHFAPVQATPRIWVHPSWAPVDPRPGGIAVVIDPRMAFGTGAHESTQLCLQGLEEHLRPGACCLDLGTGSGVLAIVAAKLGAGHVLALDVDPVAVANAGENVALNGVGKEAVQVAEGGLERAGTGPYDLILANIQSHVLRPLLGGLRARLVPGGVAVLSGLLVTEEETFRADMARAGLPSGPTRVRREWICLSGRRSR